MRRRRWGRDPIKYKHPSEYEGPGNWNGWINAVRRALGLSGTWYPPELELRSDLPDGRPVRLLATSRIRREAGEKGGLLRLQARCKCGEWISAGRMAQHLGNGRGGSYCRKHTDCRQDRELARECHIDQLNRRGCG